MFHPRKLLQRNREQLKDQALSESLNCRICCNAAIHLDFPSNLKNTHIFRENSLWTGQKTGTLILLTNSFVQFALLSLQNGTQTFTMVRIRVIPLERGWEALDLHWFSAFVLYVIESPSHEENDVGEEGRPSFCHLHLPLALLKDVDEWVDEYPAKELHLMWLWPIGKVPHAQIGQESGDLIIVGAGIIQL